MTTFGSLNKGTFSHFLTLELGISLDYKGHVLNGNKGKRKFYYSWAEQYMPF